MLKVIRIVSTLILVNFLVLCTLLTFPSPVSATFGEIVRSFNAPVQGDGRAIAFDGTNLWYTIFSPSDINIYKIDTYGQLLDSFDIGVRIGALDWQYPKYLWAGSYTWPASGMIYKIDVTTKTVVHSFSVWEIGDEYGEWVLGDIDGLAYDSVTDTLWFSADLGRKIFHIDTNGNYISGIPIMAYNSGLDYDVDTGLWIGWYNYTSPDIYSYNPRTAIVEIGTDGVYMNHFMLPYPHPGTGKDYLLPEDLALDSVTFAPETVIWSNEANPISLGNRIMAWDLSLPPPPPEYTLTITTTAGGSTTPAPGEYGPYGFWDVVTVTADPSSGYYLNHWKLDGAKVTSVTNPISVLMDTDHTLQAVFASGGVGGVVVSVDKFGLLAPYIGLTSTIIVATVATAIYVKRVKRRKEKQ